MELRKEQQDIFERIIKKDLGHGVMIFGKERAGKTTLLKFLEDYYKKEKSYKYIIRFSAHEFIMNKPEEVLSYLAKKFNITSGWEGVSGFLENNKGKILFLIDEYQDLERNIALYFRAFGQEATLARILASKNKNKNYYSSNDLLTYILG